MENGPYQTTSELSSGRTDNMPQPSPHKSLPKTALQNGGKKLEWILASSHCAFSTKTAEFLGVQYVRMYEDRLSDLQGKWSLHLKEREAQLSRKLLLRPLLQEQLVQPCKRILCWLASTGTDEVYVHIKPCFLLSQSSTLPGALMSCLAWRSYSLWIHLVLLPDLSIAVLFSHGPGKGLIKIDRL